ncbi:TIGR03118 family protein [Tunturiibacter lichenicola]|uniref:TIGR03118 family protein n=1 Tax=Tunturiibacter lichenicola TaxID=2051959 RepID=UPI003D9AB864
MMKFFLNLVAGATLTLSVSSAAFAQHYTQVNLDSNASGGAESTDPQLVGAWGLARSSGSTWWVSDVTTGLATLYDGPGAKQSLVVTIPKSDPNDKKLPTGTPTGMISNSSPTDFPAAPNKPAAFIFATLDGSIAAWNPTVGLASGANPPSTNAVTVARGDRGSGYTAITTALVDGSRYLYAANFHRGRIDVYDNTFKPVRLKGDNDHHDGFLDNDHLFGDDDRPFTDDRLPRNFVPFNVQVIGNDIVVTYALHFADNPVETPGPGLGYVDIYSSKGKLLRRLEHGDWLNAPWGVTLAPLDFGRFSHSLLVSNFAAGGSTQSAGFISAYDLDTGKFEGLLEDESGKPLSINGILSMSFANSSTPNSYDPDEAPAAELYFTAAPREATAGLFGYLIPVSEELIQGNSQ